MMGQKECLIESQNIQWLNLSMNMIILKNVKIWSQKAELQLFPTETAWVDQEIKLGKEIGQPMHTT